MHVAQPALAEMRTSESRERLQRVATALTQAMLLMSGALVVVILPVNHAFVTWWVGPFQYGGWSLTLAFAAMMVLRHLSVAIIYTLFCFGYERQISLTSLADGVVTVVATAISIHVWGPVGAPLGSIIGVLAVSLPVNGRSVAREMGLSGRAFGSIIAPVLVRIAVVGGGAAIASVWLAPASLLGVGLLVSASVALYVLLVFPLAWHGEVGPYLRHALYLSRLATFSRSGESRNVADATHGRLSTGVAAPEVTAEAVTR
jgi:O-antigen/teichoic acid export membrane protein